MYLDYYSLKEQPFSIAPDPRYLYMSERHREALAHLLYGVSGQGGFVLLTGEVGTGKTTICRCFLEQVPDNTDVAFIVNPKLSVTELLATVCDELHIDYDADASIKQLTDQINKHLLTAHSEGRHTVLIIDEAQNLAVDVLEQLRLLTNLETSEKKLLQIVLLGQPELRDMLSQEELRQLSQRITARYHLTELGKGEVRAYVKARLAVAGQRGVLFSDAAIAKLYKASKGVPRLINLLADRALLGAYAMQSQMVEKQHIKQACREINGEQNSHKKRVFTVPYLLRTAVLVFLACALFLSATVFKEPVFELIHTFVQSVSTNLQTSSTENESVEPDSSASMSKSLEEVQETAESKTELDKNDETLAAAPASGQSPTEAIKPSELSGGRSRLASGKEGLSPEALDQLAMPLSAVTTPEQKVQQDTGDAGVDASGTAPVTVSDKQEQWAVFPGSAPSEMVLSSKSDALSAQRPSRLSRFYAFRDVFAKWQLEYREEPFMLACDFATRNGLGCLHKTGNWASLLRLNRPSVLTLQNELGEQFFIALLSIEEDLAEISVEGENLMVHKAEIDQHWFGEYSLLWKEPVFGVGQPARTKNAWLRARLDSLSLPGAGSVDGMEVVESLQTKIKRFQRYSGLIPDGIAGSMTIIKLNSMIDQEVPTLRKVKQPDPQVAGFSSLVKQ